MNSSAQARLVVWWVLWLAFQSGIFVIYFALGGTTTAQGHSPDSSIWLFGTVPFALSFLVRWPVLTRMKSARVALPIFVAGIALAEATCFIGLFVFPAHKSELFVLSVFGIFQYLPYFAGRLQD